MKTSKNFSFGTVEVEDSRTSTDAYYLIHFPAGFSIEVDQDEWQELNNFVYNSFNFIDKN